MIFHRSCGENTYYERNHNVRLRHLCDPHLAEEVILDSNSSQGLEFFGLGCSL
nr:MAG TPA: hypothetical protein [Caudoviricetes sp.]